MKKGFLSVLIVMTSVFLVACGGGGAGGTSTAPPVPPSSSNSSSSSSVASSSESSIPSSSSSSSSSETMALPMPIGSGTFSTQWIGGWESYRIDEDGGTLEQVPSFDDAYRFRAAAIGLDGYVFAVGQKFKGVETSFVVAKIDFLTGEVEPLFVPPEQLDAIAVSAAGEIIAISQEEEFGKKSVYRFSAVGEVLSTVR